MSLVNASCSFKENSKPQRIEDYDEIEFNQKESEARFLFLKSEILLKRENFEDALKALEEANLKANNSSPTILKRLTQHYIRVGEMLKALESSNKLLEIEPNSKEALQLKAGTLSAMGKVDEAVSIYYEIIDSAEEKGKNIDTDEETYLLLSGLLIQNNRSEEAGAVLRKLVSKKPDSFIGTYYLGKLYYTLGENLLSIKYYEKALDINPSADQVSIELIQILALNRQITKAIERCQKLISESPGNAKARSLLAELLLGDKKIEEALSAFEEAKKINDNPSELQFKVALIKLQRKDFEGAEAEFNFILNKNPEYHQARYYLATAYASQERIDEAVNELEKIPPSESIYIKSIGFSSFLLRSIQNYSKGLEIVDKAISFKPSNIEILGYKAALLKESGDIKSALNVLIEIQKLEPENEQHLFSLGVMYDESGEKAKALEYMEKVIEVNPNHANALNYLGYTLAEANKDLLKAEELIKKALNIEPDNGYFIDSLGWVYYQMGRYKEALTQLERANKLVDSDPVIMEHLGSVYIALGQKEKGKTILNNVLDLIKDDPSNKELEKEIRQFLKTLN